jgi:hypothetical protein
MGKIDGAFGDFSGKMGNYVFYKLNGKTVCRTIGTVEKITDSQDEVLMRTRVVSPFLKPLKEFIRIGFKNTPKPQDWTFSSMASSVNKPGAVKGKYPNLEMNYEKVIVSLGSIPSPKDPVVSIVDQGLEFKWEPDIEAEGADTSDQIMVLAYFPATNKALFMTSGARRTEGLQVLKLPSLAANTIIETYISYVADDRNDVSNSVYTGQLTWTNK